MIVRNVGQTESTTPSGQISKSLIVQVSKNGSWPEKRLVSLDNWINLSTPRFFPTMNSRNKKTFHPRNTLQCCFEGVQKFLKSASLQNRLSSHTSLKVITVKFSWINSIAGLQYAYLNSDESKKSEDTAAHDLAKASRSEITLGKNPKKFNPVKVDINWRNTKKLVDINFRAILKNCFFC